MSDADKDRERLKRIVLSMHNKMKNSGCIRQADNEVVDKINWCDFEMEFDFDELLRPTLRILAEQLDLCWVSTNAGLYIGKPGEQGREFAVGMSYMRTRSENMRDRIIAMGKNNRLPELREYSRVMGISIKRLPTMLTALGAGLPKECAGILKTNVTPKDQTNMEI